jgi:DNA helicase MCM8
MMDIKTSVVGKLLSVRGHVVKARPKQLRVATADFSCGNCGAIATHEFEGGRYSAPTTCRGCKSKTFSLLRPTARYHNVQELRLQETQDESFVQAGRTPRQLAVELTADLVDTCRPGDTVMVAAVVAAVNTALQQGRHGKRAQETSTYALYLQGHSVTTMSASTHHRQQQHHHQQSVVYTPQQLEAITQLCHADHRYFGMLERRAFPFDLLVRSLCPSIIGHCQVKAGIVLSLLGGTPATGSTKEHSMRCNSHVLIVG